MRDFLQRVRLNAWQIVKRAIQWTCWLFAIFGFINIFVAFDDLWESTVPLLCRILYSCLIVIGVWLLCFILSTVYYLLKRRYTVFDAGTNRHVYAQYGDVFSEKAVCSKSTRRNIVIPVNRCFDVRVDDDLISSNTLHGKAVKRLLESGEYTEATLQAQILDSLSGITPECTLERSKKRAGNLARYPVGTIAEVDNGNEHYFFLGLSAFDEKLHPVVTEEEYSLALIGLLKFCKARSQQYPVAMPIIGGGASDVGQDEQSLLEYIVALLKLHQDYINCDIHIIARANGKNAIQISNL